MIQKPNLTPHTTNRRRLEKWRTEIRETIAKCGDLPVDESQINSMKLSAVLTLIGDEIDRETRHIESIKAYRECVKLGEKEIKQFLKVSKNKKLSKSVK